MNQFPPILNANQDDIAKMLACQTQIGTRNLEPAMERYIWKRRSDGVYLINLQKTWEKLLLAARVIVAIENPADVCAISARPYGQRAVLKFAKYTGAQAIAGRFTPGGFTNQIQEKFVEPRLLILTDTRLDHQPIRESSFVNIPTIAFCNTDSPVRHVDIVIPCNNKSKHPVGLVWWLLAREVLYLRNTITRPQPWDVMVDLFFYRDPDEADKEETGQEQFQQSTGFDATTENAEWHPAEATWDTVKPGAPDWQPQVQSEWATAPAETWASGEPAATWDNSAVPASTWDPQPE